MPIYQSPGGGTTVVGKDGMELFQMIARKAALKLEIHGLKKRGQSAYSIVKQEYGLRGNRESVLQQLCDLIEEKSNGKIKA